MIIGFSIMNKILVICTLKDEAVKTYQDVIEYLPLSNEESDKHWQNLIDRYTPHTILFGIQNLDADKMKYWREKMPESNLSFVRKGVSLHRVDFNAARCYKISIHKIAPVNAPFVAQYVNDNLFSKKTSDVSSIIGVGEIGHRVALQAAENCRQVLLYNRSKPKLNFSNMTFELNLEKHFKTANKVALCLPLNDSTNGLIEKKHIDLLAKGTTFVCISPPRVLTLAAIKALHDRLDIIVIFDHVNSGLQTIKKALGTLNLREGFIFKEEAASSHACQFAMGLAAIKICLKLN